MTHPATAETSNTPPLIMEVTEIISPLRLEAYRQVAGETDGAVAIEVVAGPGDTITVDEPGGFRGSNPRDLGNFLGVNLDNTAARIAAQTGKSRSIELGQDQTAVLVRRPATFHPQTMEQLSDFNMHDFYRRTTAKYKQLKAAKRVADRLKLAESAQSGEATAPEDN